MGDIASVVVGEAHEVGSWHGPSERAWLLRIARGAGFGNQWEVNLLAEEAASATGSRLAEPADGRMRVAAADTLPTRSLRMWWLPSARDT